MERKCKVCGSEESSMWWKCCPKHTSEYGPDVVCQKCYVILHPEEANNEKSSKKGKSS